MEQIDEFTSYHEELLDGSYDCVDRIVVNAYFEFAQSAGGFRSGWRRVWLSSWTFQEEQLSVLWRNRAGAACFAST